MRVDTSSPAPPNELPAPESAAGEPDGPGAFAKVLEGLDAGERFMKETNQTLDRGGALLPAELLRIQAGVYHFSMTVEVTSRVVQGAVNGVKTVLQGQ
jgi:hypothetical protein